MRLGADNIIIRETDNNKFIVEMGCFTYAVDNIDEVFEIIRDKRNG